MRFRDRFSSAIYRKGEIFVDAKGEPVNVGSAPGGGGGGGGGASSDAGLIVPLTAVTSHTINTLPGGDEFEITLDGSITSPKIQIGSDVISFAKQMGAGGPGMAMMVDTVGKGQLAHQVFAGYLGWVAATNQEFLDFCAAYPGDVRFLYDYGVGGANQQSQYRYLAYRQVGDDQSNPFAGVADPSSMPQGVTLAVWNAKLTGLGLMPWSDKAHPIKAETNAPKNITLRPNGQTTGTTSIASGSDGSADDKTTLDGGGIILARPYSGDWRVLSKSHLTAKTGLRRLLTGTTVSEGDGLKRAFVVGGAWSDVNTPLTSLGLDFGGGTFTGTVSIVPKTVVAL